MKNAIIVHGAYGTPEINWFPWLKGELEKRGYAVDVPQFPSPVNQSLEAWLRVAEPYLNRFTTESLLIGHSIGATFILSLLEKLAELNQPRVACLVAGFIQDLPDEGLNAINHSFYDKQFDWDTLRKTTFSLYHSPDDPFVPMNIAQHLADQLDSPLQVIPNAGHFNTASGYDRFPKLLQDILSYDV